MQNDSDKWEKVESNENFGWKKMSWCMDSRGPSFGLPLLVLVIGIYWLGNDLGFWPVPFSIWSILFIVFGAYWLIKAIIWKK